MPIDWDEFEDGLDDIIREAGEATDKKLASKISSITKLTDEEVIALFPKPADVEKLKDLMKIVESAEDHNIKVTRIVENIETFGGIIITLLTKLA